MRMRYASKLVRRALLLIAIGAMSTGAGCAVPQQELAEMMDKTEPQAVRIDWKFEASPEEIWAAWTDTDVVRRWFGSDPNGQVLAAYLDVRPAGSFEVTFANADGTQYTAMGAYRRVEAPRLLHFSWQWKNEPGVETAIRVELSAEGSGTRMEFEHAGLLHLSTHDYASGWRSTFEKMEKAVASSRRESALRQH